MNDDFLHRLREAPRPEFLAALKSRLDRQPRAARRPGFALGVLVGLVAAGAAFALYLSASRQPADGHFAEADHYRTKATPLAPAWLPTHAAREKTPATTEPAAATEAATAQRATPQSYTPGAPLRTFTYAAAQQTLLNEMLVNVVYWGRVKVAHGSIQAALQHLCEGSGGEDLPDVVQLARRITADEYRVCTHGLIEQRLGYEALVLARSGLYGPLRLTARDLYLALARRVPDPGHQGTLIDNPYTTWNQVDPALPYDPIKVFGPGPESAHGRLAAGLLLTAGCNTYPWIVALRDTDEQRYNDICGSLRSDGAYESTNVEGWNFGEMLAGNPTALGLFTLGGFESVRQKLLANPVDGITPDMSTLAAGTYPIGRTLYLYAGKVRYGYPLTYSALAALVTNPPNRYTWQPDKLDTPAWAFVPLDTAEQDAIRNDRMYRFKDVQF
jgi:ABC-type phosphate transport system substrate-binding protein